MLPDGSPELPEDIKERPDAYYQDPQAEPTEYNQNDTRSTEWKELYDALRSNRRKLLSMPGVTGVDIGYKITGGQFQNELALRVHVERKLPRKAFDDRPGELILKNNEKPKYSGQEYRLSGVSRDVTMDVIEANYKLVAELPRPRFLLEKPLLRKQVNRRRRVDPLVGGVSIGSPQAPAGTLGALVWDHEDGSICILSNWHVLAGDLRAEVGNPCFQPAVFDQGRSTDVVAHLKRWSFNRQTDAAIAQLNGSRHYSTGEILDMFQTIKDVADRPYLGMKVHKSGRSSGHTWGFIDGLYFSAAMAYSNGLVRVFEEQIHIAPLLGDSISEPGDSGSVWVANAQYEGYLAVGLHFAGDLPHSTFGEFALANPMSVVARRLNFSFRPLFLEIRDEDIVSAPISQSQQNGIGAQPAGFVRGGTLTGIGDQPVSNTLGPGGTSGTG